LSADPVRCARRRRLIPILTMSDRRLPSRVAR
jgi:hypothetical protein